jgi:hypothetical protein
MLHFYCEGLLAPHSTPTLENCPLSAVRYCSFHIFAATLHIWRPSPPSATWGRAVPWWQGTHVNGTVTQYVINLNSELVRIVICLATVPASVKGSRGMMMPFGSTSGFNPRTYGVWNVCVVVCRRQVVRYCAVGDTVASTRRACCSLCN